MTDPISCPSHYEGDGEVTAKRAMASMLSGDPIYDCSTGDEPFIPCLLSAGGRLHLSTFGVGPIKTALRT